MIVLSWELVKKYGLPEKVSASMSMMMSVCALGTLTDLSRLRTWKVKVLAPKPEVYYSPRKKVFGKTSNALTTVGFPAREAGCIVLAAMS